MLGGADPLVRGRAPGRLFLWVRIPPFLANHSGMTLYRRRLPHVYETEQAVFLTWRLHDSLPSHRAFPTDGLNSGQAFAAMDQQPRAAVLVRAARLWHALEQRGRCG